MGFAKSARIAFVAVVGLACTGLVVRPAVAQEPYKAEIDALRKAMEEYQDYKVAVRDLYLSTVGCVHYAGEKMAHHMEYAKGAMGIHFVNVTVQGAPHPMKPNVLIYEPVGKELKLVAVEWLVPLTPDTKERPTLFGQAFMGPMEGHEPLIPKEARGSPLACLVVQGQPARHVRAHQPECELQGLRLCSAGRADQNDAWPIMRPARQVLLGRY